MYLQQKWVKVEIGQWLATIATLNLYGCFKAKEGVSLWLDVTRVA